MKSATTSKSGKNGSNGKKNPMAGSSSSAGQQVNAGCSIRVICSALDSAPCVVLSTDNQRYAILTYQLNHSYHFHSHLLIFLLVGSSLMRVKGFNVFV
jgi:hypothetical protein